MNDMDLSQYMSDATNRLIRNTMKICLHSPSEIIFLKKFISASKKASDIRASIEREGTHVPSFLISSITTSCNLNCRGCYARANGICGDHQKEEMTDEEWASVFDQASKLGISFNIIAGGEPLMRRNIIEIAAERKDTVFPIFTNGTMIGEYLNLFSECRNLIPVISIEGGKDTTDSRRGKDVYEKIMSAMRSLYERHILYGVSVTVTSDNLYEITSDDFINTLKNSGCGVVFFIEYVPGKCDKSKALGTINREVLESNIKKIRESYHNMIFMSFPGDEKLFGGCIGAGRGFFHINPYGEAEACPASPYHDMNVRDNNLRTVLSSPLFIKIRAEGIMDGHHDGGCILAEKDETIRTMVEIR